jgi:hypothetical protein
VSAQERLARAVTSHTKGIEQPIIANHNLDGLIRRHTIGKTGLANLVWIIRPLIAVSDKVGHRHPFDDKPIQGTGLASGHIDCYV